MSEGFVLEPGRDCWARAHADRVAFLVDGEAYFGCLADALENAQQSVWMLGWDFHSRIRLRRSTAPANPNDPDAAKGGPDETFAGLLDRLASNRPDISIRILGWDFAMVYLFDREILPLLRFGLHTHGKVRFRLDSEHPVGASQHQKVVVIDGRIAFVGGLDVTAGRWDTTDHRPRDPRRRDPEHPDYQPFHDVQMAVDGEAATVLARLAAERWRRATGERVETPKTPQAPGAGSDPWPDSLVPDARDVEVAVARTSPTFRDYDEVREVESLHCSAIAAARHSVYIENQYLTARVVADALEARLHEAGGPEIVIVQPRECTDWLEESTMGVVRSRVVARLQEADREDRLRLVQPAVPGLADEDYVKVHAKVMIVDDRLAKVGSANLSNRSMGLDSECDLAIESQGRDDLRAAITGLRNRLLAEHLGVEIDELERRLDEQGSLIGTIESFAGEGRTLLPLDASVPEWLDEMVPDSAVVDPERPVRLEDVAQDLALEEPPRGGGSILPTAVGLLALCALAAIWRLSPLGETLDPERLAAWIEPAAEGFAGPILVFAGFVVASLVLVPVTVLILGLGLLFDPVLAVAIAIGGSLASALCGYAIGRTLWRDQVRQLAGERVNRISRGIARRGILAIALARIFPVAPFSIVNLVAGASHVRPADFALGTAIAMTPGTCLIVLLADRVLAAAREPTAPHLLTLAVVGALALGLAWITQHRMSRASDASAGSPDDR